MSWRVDLTKLPLDQSLRVVIGAQVSPINRTPGIAESILLRAQISKRVIDSRRLRRDGSADIYRERICSVELRKTEGEREINSRERGRDRDIRQSDVSTDIEVDTGYRGSRDARGAVLA